MKKEIDDEKEMKMQNENETETEPETEETVFHFVPATTYLNEVVEFKEKPVNPETIKEIQAYFDFKVQCALKKDYLEIDDAEVSFAPELTIYGENGYTTTDLSEFANGIQNDLEAASGFKIRSYYHGPSFYHRDKDSLDFHMKNFMDVIPEISNNEVYTYTCYEEYSAGDEPYVAKFVNGEQVDLTACFSTDIINMASADSWWTWGVSLTVEFDFEKHADILEKLQNCARKHLPENQLDFCEETWKQGEPELLVDDVQWCDSNFKSIRKFLDEVEEIIAPIKDEVTCGAYGDWFLTEAPFGRATWEWTDQGFVIKGTTL